MSVIAEGKPRSTHLNRGPMAATCRFKLPLAPPMFRDRERWRRLEKISIWSELQYLAISNLCTKNWEKETDIACLLWPFWIWNPTPRLLCFKHLSSPQWLCSFKQSGSPGCEHMTPVLPQITATRNTDCHRWDIQKKYTPLSRCNVGSPLVDRALAGSPLRLLMDLLLSALQRTAQLSAPLSSARLLPFPAWTAKRKVTELLVSRASSYMKSTNFPHSTHKNLLHQFKFTAVLTERWRQVYTSHLKENVSFTYYNKRKGDSPRISASNRRTKGSSSQAQYFVEETELLDQPTPSILLLH